MARQLTDLQKAFLEKLFTPQCEGDYVKAKKAAGYSDNTPTQEVVNSLKDEILEATRLYIISSAPKAAAKLNKLLDEPTTLGGASLLATAKDVLDRVGLVKPEKVLVDHSGGVLMLPPKKESGEE